MNTESMSRREFAAHLKRRAPENSEEWSIFNDAETQYELAECLKNQGPKAKSARMKAKRLFDKAWALREGRVNG